MSTSASSLTKIILVPQTLLAVYTLLPTYQSITRTQTYESQTQKAAKYSNVADHHLRKTRKTLAGSAIGVVASLVSSLTYLLKSSPSPNTSSSSSSLSTAATTILVPLVLAGALTSSHTHISNYWRGKAKVPVPGMGDYNDAVGSMAVVRKCVGYLAVGWGLIGILGGIGLISG